MILTLCIKLGNSFGIGKSEKHIISLLVLIMVDLYTHAPCFSDGSYLQSPNNGKMSYKDVRNKAENFIKFLDKIINR